MSFVKSAWDSITGKDAAEDAARESRKAAATQAAWEKDALNYLKETEEIPQQFREGSLKGLAGVYGLEGGEGSQQELIQRAIDSPLYQAIMSGQDAGEEAILRNAAATGGLRSGNTSYNLADFNTRLQNQALLESYNQQVQGLQGLAGLPSNANSIANQYSNIGQTLGQGNIAAAQALASGQGNMLGNVAGLANVGSQVWQMFSDRRLKKDIKQIGEVNGHKWYSWQWNSVAEKLGLHGSSQGVLADEIVDKNINAVSLKDGFMFVNYTRLGVM